jgi:hypothetical protein
MLELGANVNSPTANAVAGLTMLSEHHTPSVTHRFTVLEPSAQTTVNASTFQYTAALDQPVNNWTTRIDNGKIFGYNGN